MSDILPSLELTPFQSAVPFLFIFIVVVVNAYVMRFRARNDIIQSPDLKNGYEKLFKGIIFWLGTPFLILAFGAMISQLSFPQDLLNFRNPFTIVFFAWFLIFDFFGVKWIFMGRGAEFLTRHDKWMNMPVTPLFVKGLMIMVIIAHIGFFVGLWIMKEFAL